MGDILANAVDDPPAVAPQHGIQSDMVSGAFEGRTQLCVVVLERPFACSEGERALIAYSYQLFERCASQRKGRRSRSDWVKG